MFFIPALDVEVDVKRNHDASVQNGSVPEVTACGFVYADILDMVWKLIGCNAGIFVTIVGILFAILALFSAVGFVCSFEDMARSFYNRIYKNK